MKKIMLVGPVDSELAAAIQKALESRGPMTDEERFEQRISFAYGNASMSNPNITKQMVREQAEKLYGKHPKDF